MLLPGIGKKALTRDGGAMANFRHSFQGSVSSGALRSGQTAGSAGLIMTENLFFKNISLYFKFYLDFKNNYAIITIASICRG